MRFVLLACLCGLIAAPALAGDPEGWSLGRDGRACIASGPKTGDTTFSLAVLPPQHMLFFENPAFPVEQNSHTLSLRIDDAAPITVEALGSDHVYGVAITPSIGLPLRGASRLDLTIDGKHWSFTFAHADEAMDVAARCAGTKTLTEAWSDQPKPIPAAPGWQLVDNLPGTTGCSARRNSAEVNTSIIITGDGTMILIAGRPDWAKWGGEVRATLKIDDTPQQQLAAFGFQNLVMAPVKDAALLAHLRDGKQLTWTLPWGVFRAEITGLGAAADALKACKPAAR